MGKALLVSRQASALATGQECNLFGFASDTATEANTQASCTEDATFSNLRVNIISGGSGTNNFRFRDAGADGSELASRSGAGIAEDTTNRDLFNIAYTDTGSNSTIAWIVANIVLSSGHGNLHGAAGFGGLVFDTASSTNFIPLSGSLTADGSTNEVLTTLKVRAYDSFEALQVRVTANARLNTSSFRNRINNGNGTALIEFATLVTGLISDTVLWDAIADGQTVNASVTLG